MQQTADCVGVGLQQKFLFSQFRKIFAKYLISCFTKFFSNFAKFHKIQNNFVKILCFAKFYNAVLQPPYVGIGIGIFYFSDRKHTK